MQHDILTEPRDDAAVSVNGVEAGDGAGSGTGGGLALPPLTVSALMVTKADLISALRVYLPHLSDIEMIDAGRFLLTLGPEHPDATGSR